MTVATAGRSTNGRTVQGEKGLVRIQVGLRGISPMLMNPMTDETINQLITGVRPQLNKDRKFEDVARERIYLDDNGRMGVPTMNLIAALKHAGRSVKNGKKAISTATSTTLFSFCEFPTEFIPFDGLDEDGHLPWRVDKRRGVMKNGASSVAVGILRPKFDSWSLTVEVVLNEKLVTQDTLRRLFEEAGTNAGLGDFRPQKGGPFGRFQVDNWEVVGIE